MAKRWSKLKSRVKELFVEGLPLNLQCSDIRRTWNNDGALTTELGVFTVRLNKIVIWDFPSQFVTYWTRYPDGGNHYSYSVSDINGLLREYLDTPRVDLLKREFNRDYFGICDVLRAADRRINLARLKSLYEEHEQPFISAILDARTALAKCTEARQERRLSGLDVANGKT